MAIIVSKSSSLSSKPSRSDTSRIICLNTDDCKNFATSVPFLVIFRATSNDVLQYSNGYK